MIREGPTSCYWCSQSIPYTISNTHWFCWNCKRYTPNTKVGEVYKGHVCGPKEVISPEHIVVMLKCISDSPYPCNNSLIELTQQEYRRDVEKGKLKSYWHTKEFYQTVLDEMEVDKLRTVKRREVLVERIPMLANPESGEYKDKFAKFEERERRKAERKLAKRNSR